MPKARPGVTKHAQRTAKERYGIELADVLWTALGLSIEQGEHERLGRVVDDRARYHVGFSRDDGTVIHAHVIYDHQSRRIVAIVPKP